MKAHRQQSILKRLTPYFAGSRRVLIAGLLLGTIDAGAQASVPLFFRYVLNQVQIDASAFMHHGLWPVLGVGALLMIIFMPAAYFFHVLTTIAIMRLCRNLQVDLYSHVQRLSMDFFQRFKVGEITARLNNDLDSVASGVGVLAIMTWAPALLIYSLVMMYWIDVKLAALCTLLLVIIAAVSYVVLPRIKRWNRNVRDASGEVSATVTEYVGILGLLKAYSREDYAEDRVRNKSDQLLRRREFVARRQNVYTDFMQTFNRFAGPLLILIAGAWLISRRELLAGDLAAFWGYWLQLSGVAQGIVFSFSGLMGALAALDRIFALFSETSKVKDPDHPRPVSDIRGQVEFHGVDFRYPQEDGQEKEGPVLKGFNLHIRPGEQIALVGPSGAGKSTLLSLLLRFYDPDRGSIRLDETDIRSFAQSDLRSTLGVVMQESLFFSGTLADNLRLARPDSSDSQMWAALEAANAAEFVRDLPAQLNTTLGERGAKLSGGQKQRLSLARVFLKDPKIVLFDEPTSALDSESELRVKQAVKRLLTGRTSITVAHRLATVMDADRIVVMNRGAIAAEGTHSELLERSPLYAGLCQKQGIST